ncbi:MAG: DUF4870 domain-containing protein [Dehalococcoidia bacterium]|nr:DUF4870 domain-containing protein [Dehalococcoidia bacterium]
MTDNQQSSSGLQENIAGVLCYLFSIAAIIFIIIEKTNKNIRFHAFQALIVYIAFIVVWIGLVILMIILGAIHSALAAIGGILMFVFAIATLVVIVMALIKAYQCQRWRIPVIGDFAEKLADK